MGNPGTGKESLCGCRSALLQRFQLRLNRCYSLSHSCMVGQGSFLRKRKTGPPAAVCAFDSLMP